MARIYHFRSAAFSDGIYTSESDECLSLGRAQAERPWLTHGVGIPLWLGYIPNANLIMHRLLCICHSKMSKSSPERNSESEQLAVWFGA